jgi:glycosyltransferase involved in cell wall biosynthesis
MQNTELNNLAEVQYKLAKAWQIKGKIETAITGYKKALQLLPNYTQASLKLGQLLLETGNLEAALYVYTEAIKLNPNDAELQKAFINTFTEINGLDATFNLYQCHRIDNKELIVKFDDILCCSVVRNEFLRLPYFLSYYRDKGINKFFIVNNNSTDETQSYLLSQPDVYLWNSNFSFNQANFGSAWFELLLRKYGINHWCLIVDADELLYYPDCETKSIDQLCQQLERKQKRAFNAVLLDMYSDKLIKDTHYIQGESFVEFCPYFDKNFYHHKYEQSGIYRNQTVYFGGVRERVFGKQGDYYLSKVPLIKYTADCVLAGGQHFTNYPQAEIALESGCLLHFKYFSSFLNYVEEEVVRKEHYGNGIQYVEYANYLEQNDSLTLYDPYYSIPLENSQQLVELGIMQTEDIQPEFPKIHPIPGNIHRPFWSVIITVYNRLHHIEHALRSVLGQAASPEEMQIEVINDGAEQHIQDQIEAIVKSVGGDRVYFYKHPENVGHPHIFNICIERAQGQWVHILHDDDWVEPGFYSSLRLGIETTPTIGAAFCRQLYTDNIGKLRLSPLERETPGIIENWLEKIAIWCRVQFSSMVIRRDVYEQLGGFSPQAKSAFDWEMWKRIAVHYPVWYEPQTKVCFNKDTTTETSQLIKTGGQIADTRRTIEISRQYLPSAIADDLSYKALQYYAEYALNLAQHQFNQGQYKETLANVLEGLKCSPTSSIEAALFSLYRKAEQRI